MPFKQKNSLFCIARFEVQVLGEEPGKKKNLPLAIKLKANLLLMETRARDLSEMSSYVKLRLIK